MHKGLLSVALLLVTFFYSQSAQAADIGYRGWGLRGGFGFDIDQIVLGMHTDFGTLSEDNFHLQPNVEVGFGDDFLTVGVAGDVKYMLIGDDVQPFLTAGLQITYVSYDNGDKVLGGGNDSETELGFNLGGGINFDIGDKDYFLEGRLGVEGAHDLRVMLGMFF